MQEKMNRKFKDTVFVDLFSEDKNGKANFLLLYNALYDTHLVDEKKLKNIRLNQVMYMNLRNDISFLVEDKLIVLAEHQSTINENMPLRFLEYVARLYEHILDPKSRYFRHLISIPTPEFFVFYNGTEEYPTSKTLKLSDAFLFKNKKISLELIVKVYNINVDKLLVKCQPLYEYSQFIEMVRKYQAKDYKNGFSKAIRDCIKANILKEYLQRKSREVNNMLVAEYDYATDIAVQREEEHMLALQEGMKRGIERGIEQGIERGIEQGIERGIEQGIERGIEQGIERGIEQGMKQGVYSKAIDTAKTLKQMGMDTDFIVKVTKLPVAEIEKL